MGDLVCINKANELDLTKAVAGGDNGTTGNLGQNAASTKAIVPTMDIYAARVFFNLTQRMVEAAVDRRVSLLERKIDERDQEIMRIIRKMQAKMAVQKNKIQLPWWQKLFYRGK